MVSVITNVEITEIANSIFSVNQKFFANLGIELKEGLQLHKNAGLWTLKDGKPDWGNVTAHCLMCAVRVKVFAEFFGFDDDLTRDLMIAAIIHDFYKKGEKEIVVAEGLNWAAFAKASENSMRIMREAGISERAIAIANANGHGSLLATEELLKEDNLSDEQLAKLILHYVDDYTINDKPVVPVSEEDGILINDFDRRMLNNKANERYKVLDEEGRQYFNGETTFEAQTRIGHLVEERLASILSILFKRHLEPKKLPEIIEREVFSEMGN